MRPRTHSSPNGDKALRILGKLAGRNRELLVGPPSLTPGDLDGACLKVLLAFKQEAGIHLPLDDVLTVALDVLRSPQSWAYKKQAFVCLQSCFASVFSLPQRQSVEVSLLSTIASQVPLLEDGSIPVMEQYHSEPKTAWHDTVLKLLQGCVLAAQYPQLEDEAKPFLKGILTHFAMLACEQHPRRQHPLASPGPQSVDAAKHLDVIVEACAWAMCQEASTLPLLGKWMLTYLLEACVDVLGHSIHLCDLPFAAAITTVVYHSCHEHAWYRKQAGVYGLSILLDKLPSEMIRSVYEELYPSC
jgi:hypothetical protein